MTLIPALNLRDLECARNPLFTKLSSDNLGDLIYHYLFLLGGSKLSKICGFLFGKFFSPKRTRVFFSG